VWVETNYYTCSPLTLCAHGAGLLHPPSMFGESGAHGPAKDEAVWMVDPICCALDGLEPGAPNRFVLPSPFKALRAMVCSS
jgi:hypothetical protein